MGSDWIAIGGAVLWLAIISCPIWLAPLFASFPKDEGRHYGCTWDQED